MFALPSPTPNGLTKSEDQGSSDIGRPFGHQPRTDYCNSVLSGLYDFHVRRLQAVLNAAAGPIVGGHTSLIRDCLYWLAVRAVRP